MLRRADQTQNMYRDWIIEFSWEESRAFDCTINKNYEETYAILAKNPLLHAKEKQVERSKFAPAIQLCNDYQCNN